MAITFRSFNVFLLPLKKFLLWLVFDFSGIRAIYEKIRPPTEKTKSGDYKAPSTFLLWIVGIYIAFFGVASQRYENSMDKLEARANGIITLVASNTWKSAISRIPAIQNTVIPISPTLINPISVFKSTFGKREKNKVIINLLKDIIKDKKKNLAGIDLSYVVLDDLDLIEADFTDANLVGASFIGANLLGTTFKNAILINSKLTGAGLLGVVFENAVCIKTDFTNIKIITKSKFIAVGKKGGGISNPGIHRAKQNYIKKMLDQHVISKSGYSYDKMIMWELLKADTLYESTFNEGTLATKVFTYLKKKKPFLFVSPLPSAPSNLNFHIEK